MAYLIKNNSSIDGFFKNTVIPLSLYGLGSVDSILSLKKYEIEELKAMTNDSDITDLILMLHGYTPKT